MNESYLVPWVYEVYDEDQLDENEDEASTKDNSNNEEKVLTGDNTPVDVQSDKTILEITPPLLYKAIKAMPS